MDLKIKVLDITRRAGAYSPVFRVRINEILTDKANAATAPSATKLIWCVILEGGRLCPSLI